MSASSPSPPTIYVFCLLCIIRILVVTSHTVLPSFSLCYLFFVSFSLFCRSVVNSFYDTLVNAATATDDTAAMTAAVAVATPNHRPDALFYPINQPTYYLQRHVPDHPMYVRFPSHLVMHACNTRLARQLSNKHE